MDTREYETAIVILQGMLKAVPESADLHYLAGVALDGNDNKTAAIAQLRQVAPGSRFFQNAAVHAALLYQELEKLDAAIALIQEAIAKRRKIPSSGCIWVLFMNKRKTTPKPSKRSNKGWPLIRKTPDSIFGLG